MIFEPSVDGAVVPAVPLERLQQGASAGVDVLTGSNSDEHALFFVPNGVAGFIDEPTLTGGARRWSAPIPRRCLPRYRDAKPDATPGELMIAARRRLVLPDPGHPRRRSAQGQRRRDLRLRVLLAARRSSTASLGACHALEIAFVFDNLDDPVGEPMLGPTPPQALADEMHGAWVAFVKTGSPGWAPYGDARTTAHVQRGEHHRRRSGGCSATGLGGRALTAARGHLLGDECGDGGRIVRHRDVPAAGQARDAGVRRAAVRRDASGGGAAASPVNRRRPSPGTSTGAAGA